MERQQWRFAPRAWHAMPLRGARFRLAILYETGDIQADSELTSSKKRAVDPFQGALLCSQGVRQALCGRTMSDMPVMIFSTASMVVFFGMMSSATTLPRRSTTIRSTTWKTW